jgi:hypothetical protein
MRTWWFGVLLGAGALLLTGPPGTSAESLPPDFDAELAAEFQDELLGILAAGGIDIDAAQLDRLLGAPGDLDVDPGTPVLLVIADDAVQVDAEDIPGGSSLTGPCMGIAISFDDEGQIIDIAADFDPDGPPMDLYEYYESDGYTVEAAFTASNPFRVDVNGFVAYAGVAGAAGDGPRDHTWRITTFGQTIDEGGDDNADGENRNAGGVDLASQLPAAAKVDGLFKISGEMTADDGFACAGSGYFATEGGRPVAQAAGTVLVLLGGLGAFFTARPARTWKG